MAEPIYVENQGRFKPVVHLLADHGFSTYSTVIEARIDTVKNKPDLCSASSTPASSAG